MFHASLPSPARRVSQVRLCTEQLQDRWAYGFATGCFGNDGRSEAKSLWTAAWSSGSWCARVIVPAALTHGRLPRGTWTTTCSPFAPSKTCGYSARSGQLGWFGPLVCFSGALNTFLQAMRSVHGLSKLGGPLKNVKPCPRGPHCLGEPCHVLRSAGAAGTSPPSLGCPPSGPGWGLGPRPSLPAPCCRELPSGLWEETGVRLENACAGVTVSGLQGAVSTAVKDTHTGPGLPQPQGGQCRARGWQGTVDGTLG